MNNKFSFNTEADCFERAFPIGNGKLGAMIYGGVCSDRLSLNSDTLWSGHSESGGAPKNAPQIYRQAAQLVNEGKNYEADKLLEENFNYTIGQYYLPGGSVYINSSYSELSDYKRTLNMSDGTVHVGFKADGVSYNRIYFASEKYDCIAVKEKSGKNGGLSFKVSYESEVRLTETEIRGDVLLISGICPYDADRTEYYNPQFVYSDKEKSISFTAAINVRTTGGSCTVSENEIRVESADEAEIYISIKTSYIDPYSVPDKEHKNAAYEAVTSCKSFCEAEECHKKNFAELYSRVSLNLGGDTDDCDNERRLAEFDGTDKGMYELLFNYGRYLMISASRSGSRAMNLQGIWNEQLYAPWNSGYTTNINTEMNYWPSFICNLGECFEPFVELVKEGVRSGRRTARDYYDAKGFIMHHNTDIWAQTGPVSRGVEGSSAWSPWCMASGWLVYQLFDGYEYTLDKEYLKEIYPIAKEASEFYLDMLSEVDGYLTLMPSSSPENKFLLDGKKVSMTKMSTITVSIIRELFEKVIEAGSILGTDIEFCDKLRSVMSRLYPLKIGNDGRLLEWYGEKTEADPQHRHVSHLFSLYPGHDISVDNTPELAEACRKTLEKRGDGGTGWSLAWKINFWAMLHDGNHALRLLNNQLTLCNPKKELSISGGGTYPNMLDAHPPFQIDGNFGAAAGIANMLLQSELGVISVLPALPDNWSNGSFSGLCAKGNITVSASWNDRKVTELTLETPVPQTVIIKVNGTETEFRLEANIKSVVPLSNRGF